MQGGRKSSDNSFGINDNDVRAIKKQRGMERLIRFLRLWWVPIASAVAGLSLGSALIATNVNNCYPYATAAVSITATKGTNKRSPKLLLLTSVLSFLLGFVAVIGLHEVAIGCENIYGVAPEYGVYSRG